MENGTSVMSDLVKGAVAGAAASWVMNEATTWMYEHESEKARQQEKAARRGQTAYATAAEKAAGVLGIQLADDQRRRAGAGIHWATGIGAGAMYAVLRRRWPAAAAGLGTPFGTGIFLAVDEVMNPLLGLTMGPQAFPWQTHARGLGGHLVFGVTTEFVLEGLDRAERAVVRSR